MGLSAKEHTRVAARHSSRPTSSSPYTSRHAMPGLQRSKSLTLPKFLRRPTTDSPFSDPASRAADTNAMRDALKDVVVSLCCS